MNLIEIVKRLFVASIFLFNAMNTFSQAYPIYNYYPTGEKIYPIGILENGGSDYEMHGYIESIVGCNKTFRKSESFPNDYINALLINGLFNKNYETAPHDKPGGTVVGNINWEVFNDHSCFSKTAGCDDVNVCIHKGIDYKATTGTLVYSPFNDRGKVIGINVIKNEDKIVCVYYQKYDFTAFFVHVKNVAVSVGSVVNYGTHIAEIGVENHLHFEIKKKKEYGAGSSLNTQTPIDRTMDPRAALMLANSIKLNQFIPIYGGSKLKPKQIRFFYNSEEIGGSLNLNHIFEVEIRQGKMKKVLDKSKITVNSIQVDEQGRSRQYITLSLNSSDVSTFNNNGENILFTFRYTNNGVVKYLVGCIYFFDIDIFRDVKIGDRFCRPVQQVVNWSILKGYPGTNSFNSSEKVTNARAITGVIRLGVLLGYFNLNTSTANGTFADTDIDKNPLFPYIQTYYNLIGGQSGELFRPNDLISEALLSKYIVTCLKLKSTDVIAVRKNSVSLNFSNSNVLLNDYMSLLYCINYEIQDEVDSDRKSIRNIWSYWDVSANASISSNLSVSGNGLISNARMAVVLRNLYYFAYKKRFFINPPSKKINENSGLLVDEYQIIGDIYDNADITSGDAPLSIKGARSVNSGESIVLQYPSDYDNYGNPLHFYWSMQSNGASIVSNTTNYRSITFKAPVVSSPTKWDLYTYSANNRGKSSEAFITIYVGNGTDVLPSSQAHSLSFYDITPNSLQANWTRGNGKYCLVTASEYDGGYQDYPESGVNYNTNTNYSYANTLTANSKTKVIYAGTNSSCKVEGLNPNTKYQFAVFEFNVDNNSYASYNTNNVPISTISTLSAINNSVSASYTWNSSQKMVVGQSYTFTNSSANANSYLWSVTPSASISNPTSNSSTNISFPVKGQYCLSLTASNSITGQTNTYTQCVYIYDSNDLLADLQPTNLVVPSVSAAGQSFTVSCNVSNNNVACTETYANWITFVLSTDQILDEGDWFLGREDYTIKPGESIPISHLVHNIDNTFSGNYYIIAKTDYASDSQNGYVIESNELNNTTSQPITIQGVLPDFVAKSLSASPTTVASGQAFSVTGSFQNIGLGNATSQTSIGLYLSTDNSISVDDLYFGALIGAQNDLNYANSSEVVITDNNVRLPYDIINGNYYLIAAIDFSFLPYGTSSSDQVEISETNNWKVIPITVNNPNQPNVNASGYQIINISQNSLRLKWTRGDGSGCIVIASEGTQIPFATFDNRDYIPNTDFSLANGIYRNYYNGSYTTLCKVVYDGTGSSVDVTGLKADEDYSFIVLEYNGTGTNKDYLQVLPISAITAHTNYSESSPFRRILGNLNLSGNSNSYLGIKFFDENNGVLFKKSLGIGTTSDGGKTWLFNNNPVVSKAKNSWLTSSHWINGGVGWYGFYEQKILLSTQDFGKTWNSKVFEGPISDIFYLDINNGYVSVGTEYGLIYNTKDGGLSWSALPRFPKQISSLFFINSNVGWASMLAVGNNLIKVIYKTIDGGLTWQSNCISTPNDYAPIVDIYFTDQNNGFAIMKSGYLLKTNDGGVSWTVNNVFNLQTGINCDSKITFVNQNVGFINLLNTKLAKTIDGGKTWSVFDIQSNNTNGNIAELCPLNENIVYVSGVTGLLKTTTGGQSNSIKVESVNTSYCQGNAIQLSYSMSGVFEAGNIFKVQLSDASGNFDAPTDIYTFDKVGSETVSVPIGTNITSGSGYKLRLISTNPNIISNTSNVFSIQTANNESVAINASALSSCPNQPITFTAVPTNGGQSPTYSWKQNGLMVGTNSNTYSTSTLKSEDIVWVEMSSSATCASTSAAISNQLSVSIESIEKPYIQAIDNILATNAETGIQWFRNGQIIPGAIYQFYEATQTGFYQVTVSSNGCIETSDTYSLTSLDVDDNEFWDEILTVFPIPSYDYINIETKNNKDIEFVKIFNLQGGVVKNKKEQSSKVRIEMSDLSSGIYILEVVVDKKIKRVKIVKG